MDMERKRIVNENYTFKRFCTFFFLKKEVELKNVRKETRHTQIEIFNAIERRREKQTLPKCHRYFF